MEQDPATAFRFTDVLGLGSPGRRPVWPAICRRPGSFLPGGGDSSVPDEGSRKPAAGPDFNSPTRARIGLVVGITRCRRTTRSSKGSQGRGGGSCCIRSNSSSEKPTGLRPSS